MSGFKQKMVSGNRAMRHLAKNPSAVLTAGSLLHGPNWDASKPWWNEPAIRHLQQNIFNGAKVFEWGCGGSTIWLIQQGATVLSIEHDAEWAQRVKLRCPEADILVLPGASCGEHRAEPEHAELLCEPDRSYFDDYVKVVDKQADESLDVVIVDGICRVECMRRAIPKVKPGGVLVVDDTDYSFLRSIESEVPNWNLVRMSGFKRPFDVRETSFFHRP